jgi:group I intron endonuclease
MNTNISGVYKIVNIINKKFYIGSTKDFNHRWKNEHKVLLNKNKHINRYLQYAWNKYTEKNFKFEIIEECSPDQCLIREQYYLDTLTPWNCEIGYNLSKCSGGGDTISYHPNLEEIKKKHSINTKERWNKKTETDKIAYSNKMKGIGNPNWRGGSAKGYCVDCRTEIFPINKRCMMCSKRGKNNPFYGKTHSKESKIKLSKSRKGKNMGKDNPLFGVGHTEETKLKMSLIRKEKYKNKTIEDKLTIKIKNNKYILRYKEFYYITYKSISVSLNQDTTTLQFKCRHKSSKWQDYEEIRLNLETPKALIEFYTKKLKENPINNS